MTLLLLLLLAASVLLLLAGTREWQHRKGRPNDLPPILACYACEMGEPRHTRRSRQGRRVQVLCDPCVRNAALLLDVYTRPAARAGDVASIG